MKSVSDPLRPMKDLIFRSHVERKPHLECETQDRLVLGDYGKIQGFCATAGISEERLWAVCQAVRKFIKLP